MCPPLFSKFTLCAILFIYLLAACWTSYAIWKRNYPNEETTHWILLGGLTSSSIEFRVRVPLDGFQDGSDPEMVVATDPEYTDIVFQQDLPTAVSSEGDEDIYVHSMTAIDLFPNTEYYYASRTTTPNGSSSSSTSDNNSQNILRQGRFRMAPEEGTRTPFSFLASACSWSGSTHAIYDTIYEQHAKESLFFIHLGDLHYQDLNTPNLETRIQAIDNVLASKPQRNLFANQPMVYMWDDHDWLGNNAAAEYGTPGRETALQSYLQAMPYYSPLPSSSSSSSTADNNATSSNDNIAMYQAFTIGTVRFILSDLRSEATKDRMYSETQKEWLFDELSVGGAAGQYDFIIWLTTKPWIGKEDNDPNQDSWSRYAADRAELSAHIRNVVTTNNLLAIGADAHMIAFDDGSNTYYGGLQEEGSSAIKSFPMLQTGPLDRLGSFKGGPYSEGCTAYQYERNHQYSTIDFLENEEGQACLELKGYRNNGKAAQQQVLSKRLCAPDIFTEISPGLGSCEAKSFSQTNTILIGVAGGLLVIAMGLTCGVVGGTRAAIVCSVVILVLFAATYILGFLIPVAGGVDQYNAFQTTLICLLQIATVVLYLFAWRCFGTKKTGKKQEEETTDEGQDPQVEAESDNNNDNEAGEPAPQTAQVY